MAISVGQITIIDFNDAVTLTGWLSSNLSKSVRYDGNSEAYNPDFTTTNLTVTPSLFKAGGATDLMIAGTGVTKVVWTRKNNTQATAVALSAGETMNAAFPKALKVTTVPFSASVFSVEYICTITYLDPTTGLDLIYTNSITFNKVTDGNNVALADIVSDDGFAFKNEVPATIKLEAKLFRGVVHDESDLTHVWQKLVGATWTTIAGQTTKFLTVAHADITNMQQYKVKITDTERHDTYEAVTTIMDFNDATFCDVVSSNGEIFKNGEVTTTLTAKLFQNGNEIDAAGTKYTYTWAKVDKDGNSTAAGTGKDKVITIADVTARATFVCTVS